MVLTQPRSETRVRTRPALIDCDFHNELNSIKDLYPYLAKKWHDHIESWGTRGPQGGYYPRFMDHREDARPPSGRVSGSEVRYSAQDYLDPYNVTFATCIPLTPAGRQLNFDLDAALATAVNDWQVAEWLDPEPRLRASLVVAHEDSELAVAEIDRLAHDRRFAQVLLLVRTREPLGKRRFWPIYEAAARHNLPIGIHFGGSGGSPFTGAGWPSFYLEDHGGMPQAFQAQLISMVTEGIFERFPALKVVLIEGGFGWLPSLLWRLDRSWERLRDEVPHLKRPPSEYVREHIWLTTQPMEEPSKPAFFPQLLEQLGMDDHLMFATDYPHWDFDAPDRAFPTRLPADLERRILADNARALYGLA